MGGNVLGGAASGAATGTAIMPGWGTAIGAVAGGLMGAMQDDGSGATDEQANGAGNAAGAYNQYAGQALNYLNNGYGAARNDIRTNYAQAQNEGAPYSFAGLNALDMLQQGIGMKTVNGGSFALKQALTSNQKIQDFGRLYQMAVASDPGAAAANPNGLDNTHMSSAIWQDPKYANDLGHTITSLATQISQNGGPKNEAQKQFITQYQAMGGSAGMTGGQFLSQNNITEQQLTPQQQNLVTQYNNGTLNDSASYDPNQAVKSFLDTPEYRLLFDQGGSTTDPNATVLDRFRADPGYQFSVDQGVKARDASAAAKGMLLSGNQLTALTDYGQGMANQQFNGYRDRLANTYGNYLNRLGVVSGQGAQFASNNQNILTGQGNNLSNLSTGLANQQANVLTNQGDVNANSILAASNARSSGYATAAAANNQGLGNMMGSLPGLLSNLNIGGKGSAPVTDYSATGGRMPQFDTSSWY
jgi:hypothetical protein